MGTLGSSFYNRVAARADLKHQNGIERTRQVLSVLWQAIARGEIRDILESLPGEYEELFKHEPSGETER